MENTGEHTNFDKHKLNTEQLIVAFYKYDILSSYILCSIDIDNLNEFYKERLQYIKNLKESYHIRMIRNERYYRSMLLGIGKSYDECISTQTQLLNIALFNNGHKVIEFIENDDENSMVLNIPELFFLLDKYENEIKVLWEDFK